MYNVIPTNIKRKTALLKFVRQQLPRGWSFVQGLNKIAQSVDVFFACPPWWASFLLEHALTSCCPVPPSTCSSRGRRRSAQPGSHPGYCQHSRHLEASAPWRTSEAPSQSSLAARGCVQRAAQLPSHPTDQLISGNTWSQWHSSQESIALSSQTAVVMERAQRQLLEGTALYGSAGGIHMDK